MTIGPLFRSVDDDLPYYGFSRMLPITGRAPTEPISPYDPTIPGVDPLLPRKADWRSGSMYGIVQTAVGIPTDVAFDADAHTADVARQRFLSSTTRRGNRRLVASIMMSCGVDLVAAGPRDLSFTLFSEALATVKQGSKAAGEASRNQQAARAIDGATNAIIAATDDVTAIDESLSPWQAVSLVVDTLAIIVPQLRLMRKL